MLKSAIVGVVARDNDDGGGGGGGGDGQCFLVLAVRGQLYSHRLFTGLVKGRRFRYVFGAQIRRWEIARALL